MRCGCLDMWVLWSNNPHRPDALLPSPPGVPLFSSPSFFSMISRSSPGILCNNHGSLSFSQGAGC